jgi:hypothetical protein
MPLLDMAYLHYSRSLFDVVQSSMVKMRFERFVGLHSQKKRCKMRKIFLLLLAAAVLSSTVKAQSQTVANSEDEPQLRKIEEATGQLEQQNDSSKMDLFADDWVSVGGGKVITKKQFEENVNRNFVAHGSHQNPYTIEKKNMQVYLFADIAVVTYVKDYRQTTDTTKFFDEDITDVFARTPKGWIWQFSKSSPVIAKPPAN